MLGVIDGIAMIWIGFLLLTSMITVHQYSLGKALGVGLVTVIAMLLVVFLGLLFVNLISQMAVTLESIYYEIIFRL